MKVSEIKVSCLAYDSYLIEIGYCIYLPCGICKIKMCEQWSQVIIVTRVNHLKQFSSRDSVHLND